MRKFYIFLLMAFAGLAHGSVTQGSVAYAENVAIIGGRVVTMGDAGIIENATILIERGRIAAVGSNVTIPPGYRTIDAGGNFVTPGLMNPMTTLGLEEVSLEGSTVDYVNNGSSQYTGNSHDSPFSAAFNVAYAYNPNATAVPVARIEGVTRAVITPATGANIFGGSAALVDLSGDINDLPTPNMGMVVDLGSNGGSNAGGSRAGAMGYFIRALGEADRLERRGERSLPDRDRDSVVSQIDAEALIPVVNGKEILLISVSRASDMIQIINILDSFKNLRVVFVGAEEAWMVADKIAAKKIPVMLSAKTNLPNTFDSLASTYYNAARLVKAGVKITFMVTGDSAGQARLIPQEAGIAVAYGLDWLEAMKAITSNPADIFGIGDNYGRIERGMDADVVIWDGDPLEVMSAPTAVFIKGEEMPLTSRQTELRDRYMNLKIDKPFAYKK